MQVHVLAVGTRMPDWVNEAVATYAKRLPPRIKLIWHELKAEPRSNASVAVCQAREAQRLQDALPKGAWRVLLDENGTRRNSRSFAQRVEHWTELGRPVALLVGGPDGFDESLRDNADETLSLSDMTLPHPLVRVVLAEQLYRASTILSGHPYHRQ